MAKKSGCCKHWWGWLLLVVVLAVIAGLLLYFFYFRNNNKSNSAADEKKYSDALKVAMQFFDVQRAGKLVDNKISWRGDSALKDGSDAKLDLSKGMYDAGDHVKFGFPMAFTATVLSWAIIEYGNHMDNLGQLKPAQDSLRWMTDFLVNAHPSPNVLYIQVGDGKADHDCWDRPEDMSDKRPLTQVNSSTPGSDVAAETAAAMAAASLVFKKSDSTYSGTLLKHAQQLFTFADKNRGLYSKNIPAVATFYNSTGYKDELLWAASWLYHATNDKSYFEYVTDKNGDDFANWNNPTWFSWDNKQAGTQVLLSRLSFFGQADSDNSNLQNYKSTAEAVMCTLLPDSPSATSSRTDGGLIWVSEWNSLQHPVASAFLAVLYSDYMLTTKTDSISCGDSKYKPSDLRDFARSQADYVLGSNPSKMSFLVGYGDKYPQFVHHRGASIPSDKNPKCGDGFKWLKSTDPNPNVAIGAMVGGPFKNESYIDVRNNSMQGEPTTYNSAVLVGLLSSLVSTSDAVKSFT